MSTVNTIILITFGLIPSIVWLILFYQRDPRPEPKYLVTKTFLFGIIIAPLVLLLEILIQKFLDITKVSELLSKTVIFLNWGAFVEEYMKYWVVKNTVVKKPDFDEPHDAIIYMICSALGFAAIENILVLFQIVPDGLKTTFGIWILRFTGATLLHALSSGIVGYFLGLAWFFHHFHKHLVAFGIIIASFLHFTFNIIIFLGAEGKLPGALSNSAILLFGMLILLLILFDRLQTKYKQSLQNLSTLT